MNESLLPYIPMDRRRAMAQGLALPDRTSGSALFADVSGFTPLTEALVNELGPQRGAEELTGYLNEVYDALIDELHRWGGSAIAFAGDAVTCWFDGDDGQRSAACALAMQEAMQAFSAVQTPAGSTVYIAGTLSRLDGGLPDWDPGAVSLTAVSGGLWTITLTGDEGTSIEYKYTLGSWDFVEKGASCEELSNRTLTLEYGSDGQQVVNDTVANWRNVAPCGN